MRWKAKDQLILEDIYNQCDSDYYNSYESKIGICHIGLHYQYHWYSITSFTGEYYIRISRNTHLAYINANMRFAYENSYCCKCKLSWCAMKIYVFQSGLGSYRYHKKLINYDRWRQ